MYFYFSYQIFKLYQNYNEGNVYVDRTINSTTDGAPELFKSLLESYTLEPEFIPVFKCFLKELVLIVDIEVFEEKGCLKRTLRSWRRKIKKCS